MVKWINAGITVSHRILVRVGARKRVSQFTRNLDGGTSAELGKFPNLTQVEGFGMN